MNALYTTYALTIALGLYMVVSLYRSGLKNDQELKNLKK